MSMTIDVVEWPGRGGAVVVTGRVTGMFPRLPGQRLVVRSGEGHDRPVHRAWIESNPRPSVLRVHLWGVRRTDVAPGMTLTRHPS